MSRSAFNPPLAEATQRKSERRSRERKENGVVPVFNAKKWVNNTVFLNMDDHGKTLSVATEYIVACLESGDYSDELTEKQTESALKIARHELAKLRLSNPTLKLRGDETRIAPNSPSD